MKAIFLSCETASLLVEKQKLEPLNSLDALRLKLHLALCKLCQHYVEQSELIESLLADLQTLELEETKLESIPDETDRVKKLEHRILQALKTIEQQKAK